MASSSGTCASQKEDHQLEDFDDITEASSSDVADVKKKEQERKKESLIDKRSILSTHFSINSETDNDKERNEKKLRLAAKNGDVLLINALIENGTDINWEDELEMRPIHYAAAYGQYEVIKLLAVMKNVRLNESKWNLLDLAIDNKQAKAVLAILAISAGDLNMHAMLQSRSWIKCKTGCGFYDTPMRKLIRNMPDIARLVFNRCTETKGSEDNFTVKFTYKYLDDVVYLEDWKTNTKSFIVPKRGDLLYYSTVSKKY